MKQKIIVKAPALSASGYGEHARFVLRSLRAHEDKFDIHLQNLNWGKTSWLFEDSEERKWIDNLIKKTMQEVNAVQAAGGYDLSLQVTIPNEFEKIAKTNIGITAGIETTKVAPQWLQKSNMMDKVIVVSNHAKYGFDNTKYPVVDENKNVVTHLACQVPVEVVGYPVRKHDPAELDIDFETEFNFLAVALWGPRKNMEKTIINFLEEFKNEEVGLVLKTSFSSGSTYDRLNVETALENILKKHPDRKCKIYLLHGRMSEEELTALYNHDKIKCMLSLAHGEGFGLPLFEAACNGLPIVATDWSGQLDFLYAPQKDKKGKTKKKGLFGKVSYNLGKVQNEAVWEGVVIPDSQWAYPNDASAKKKMREVYSDYQLALNKAKKLQEFVLEEFNSEKMHNEMFSKTVGTIASWNDTQEEEGFLDDL